MNKRKGEDVNNSCQSRKTIENTGKEESNDESDLNLQLLKE